MHEGELKHHGILGMKWGIRRYQNKDGSLTPAGKKRYYKQQNKVLNIAENIKKTDKKVLKEIETLAEYDPEGMPGVLKKARSLETTRLEDALVDAQLRSDIAQDSGDAIPWNDLSEYPGIKSAKRQIDLILSKYGELDAEQAEKHFTVVNNLTKQIDKYVKEGDDRIKKAEDIRYQSILDSSVMASGLYNDAIFKSDNPFKRDPETGLCKHEQVLKDIYDRGVMRKFLNRDGVKRCYAERNKAYDRCEAHWDDEDFYNAGYRFENGITKQINEFIPNATTEQKASMWDLIQAGDNTTSINSNFTKEKPLHEFSRDDTWLYWS